MKILYFGDCSPGAIGIINRDIKAIIDAKYPEIQFDLLDWSPSEINSIKELIYNEIDERNGIENIDSGLVSTLKKLQTNRTK